MKVSEYFDSQKRESKKLVDELAAHMATWPGIKKQFDAVDCECITLAGKLAAARLAGSPTAITIEAELKKLRWKRDDGKSRFSIKRDEFHRLLENITREPIRLFHSACLDRVQNLSKLYRFERLEPSHDFGGRRVRYGVKISHNSAALSLAKDRIFEAIKEVTQMIHSPLADIEKRISEFRKEFENFEYDTMEIEEVSEQAAADMKPGRDEPSVSAGTVYIAPGVPNVFVKNQDAAIAPRLQKLESKINFLEK